jgi:hypothetical protein
MNIFNLGIVNPFPEPSPYAKLLMKEEWLKKRQEIFKRDNFKCTKCDRGATVPYHDAYCPGYSHCWVVSSHEKILSDKPYHLELHHKYYIVDRLPWSYEDSAFETLCNWCHFEYHKNNRVPVFKENLQPCSSYNLCTRCNGIGWLPQYEHVSEGRCFKCGGTGYNNIFESFKMQP